MKSWTIDEMVAERPCYSRERIEQLAGGRKRLTLLEILDLDISDKDKVWVCARDNEYRAEWIERVITRAVETHALRCGVPVVEQWAARWLSGADRSNAAYVDAAHSAAAAVNAAYVDAAHSAAAAAYAYAAEWARQVQDMRDVIAERARKDGEI